MCVCVKPMIAVCGIDGSAVIARGPPRQSRDRRLITFNQINLFHTESKSYCAENTNIKWLITPKTRTTTPEYIQKSFNSNNNINSIHRL